MPTKATDALLKDHLLIRKVMKGVVLDNPRFPEVCKTLERALRAHAWFEDEIFLPVIKAEPLFFKRFTDEITQEHRDLDQLVGLLRATPLAQKRELDIYSVQLRSLLETHFRKEEDAIFPLAERLLTEEGLIHLGDEMKRRAAEVRGFIEP